MDIHSPIANACIPSTSKLKEQTTRNNTPNPSHQGEQQVKLQSSQFHFPTGNSNQTTCYVYRYLGATKHFRIFQR
jgi:hypothetical protein